MKTFLTSTLILAPLGLGLFAPTALAQSVLPAVDGTDTQVTPAGNRYDITGGTVSGDGTNLFHSFERFGLTAEEVANFISQPAIENILGRVTGGEASIINGLLQVSGSNANLYLLNPAGILLGPGAALNLDGGFTATTAAGVSFGSEWFPAVGAVNYAALAGQPTGLGFHGDQGSILNQGNLTVSSGETIRLIGGAVINTGTIEAPAGTITIAAIPGENLVRITQAGSPLSLELSTLPVNAPLPVGTVPLNLPELLTQAPAVATGMAVAADGRIRLTNEASETELPTDTGTAVVVGNLSVAGSYGGNIAVVGERVALLDAGVDASGLEGGGTVHIGGSFQGQGPLPNARRTLIDHQTEIFADAIEAGNGGEVVVWADESTWFLGRISAMGGSDSGDGGFVEVSGQDFLDFQGSVEAAAPAGIAGTLLLDPTNIFVDVEGTGALVNVDEFTDPDLDLGIGTTIAADTINAATANVVLQATDTISFNAPIAMANAGVGLTAEALNRINVFAPITTNGGDLTLTTRGASAGPGSANVGAVNVEAPIATQGGKITINGTSTNGEDGIRFQGETVVTVNSGGGDIVLTGSCAGLCGELAAEGVILLGAAISSEGGNISIEGSSQGDEGIQLIFESTIDAGGGQLTLSADQINLQDLQFGGGSLLGSGDLLLQPLSADANLVLGGPGAATTTFLNGDELLRLGDGFQSVTIGRANGSGLISLADTATFSDPITLQAPAAGGTINTTGGELSSNAAVTLTAADGITTGILTAGENLTIQGDSNGDGAGPVSATQIIATAGDIAISGASSLADTPGVEIVGAAIASGGNNISLEGTATGAGEGAEGVRISAQFDNIGEVLANASVDTAGGALTIRGSSDNGDGVALEFVDISSGGGDIAVTGSSTGSGGTTSFLDGIDVIGGTINSSGGDISLVGDSADTAGISVFDTAFNSEGGSIIWQGTSTGNLGPGIEAIGPVVNSAGGNITLTGSGTDFAGIDAFATFMSSDGGNITWNGTSTFDAGITMFDGLATSTTGNISLTGSSASSNGIEILTDDTLAAATGAIALTAGEGSSIVTADLSTRGGSIRLEAPSGQITTGNITTSPAANPGSTAASGDVVLQAGTAITTGNIITASGAGRAGSVLLDPSGDIQVGFIDATGATGGSIDITTGRFFRATGSFLDRSGRTASLSTANNGGNITIRHGGERLNVPFTVGDASQNGTAAAITSGSFTLSPIRSFPFTFIEGSGPGQISLLTGDFFGEDPIANPPRPCEGTSCNANSPFLSNPSLRDSPLADPVVITAEPQQAPRLAAAEVEADFVEEFTSYWGPLQPSQPFNLDRTQGALQAVRSQTGQTPAIIFVTFGVAEEATAASSAPVGDANPLEIILVTPEGDPIYKQIPETARREVLNTVERLRRQVTDPNLVGSDTYLVAAQRLHRWLIEPIKTELETAGITNLAFVMPEGLRLLPVAALHDGEQFLVERYSLGLLPSVSLSDLSYRPIQNSTLLIGGASEFITQTPLPAAPLEIELIQSMWDSQSLTESAFTTTALKQQRQQTPYGIIHLATHGEFLRGKASDSYLQFFDSRLRLTQLRELGWNDPPVELVSLSACQTALGNREAELGLAGLSVASGAKSVLASLWQISDESTAALMAEFYRQLQQGSLKAESLRQAQIALLRGNVYSEEAVLIWSGGRAPLPPELVGPGRRDFTHPYFWSAFTLVGSPW